MLHGAGPYPFSKDPNAKSKPNVNLAEPSNPITLVVRPAPATVAVNTKGGALKAGGTLEIEVTVTRQNGSKRRSTSRPGRADGTEALGRAGRRASPEKRRSSSSRRRPTAPLGAAAGVAVRATIPVRGEPVDVDAPAALTIAK